MARVRNTGKSPYGFYDTSGECRVVQPGGYIEADVPEGIADLCARDDYQLSIEVDDPVTSIDLDQGNCAADAKAEACADTGDDAQSRKGRRGRK